MNPEHTIQKPVSGSDCSVAQACNKGDELSRSHGCCSGLVPVRHLENKNKNGAGDGAGETRLLQPNLWFALLYQVYKIQETHPLIYICNSVIYSIYTCLWINRVLRSNTVTQTQTQPDSMRVSKLRPKAYTNLRKPNSYYPFLLDITCLQLKAH